MHDQLKDSAQATFSQRFVPERSERNGYNNNEMSEIREVNRSKWFEIRFQNPELNRNKLRTLSPALFTWLYGNDKEWLYQNLPTKQANSPSKNRNPIVDWGERDDQIYVCIEQAVNDLVKNPGRPVRITVSRVGMYIGKFSLLQRNLERLPKCKTLLEQKIETVEKFQLRKLQTLMESYKKRGIEPSNWCLLREAGIRTNNNRIGRHFSTVLTSGN